MTSYLRDYHLSSLHSKHYRNEERDADLSGDFYSGLSGGLGLWRAVTIGVDNIQPLSYPPAAQTFVRLSGDLIITGDLHAGYMTISGDKWVGDDLDISGTLIVENTTLLKGATTIDNDLVLSGNYSSVGNISISGDIICDDLRVFGE